MSVMLLRHAEIIAWICVGVGIGGLFGWSPLTPARYKGRLWTKSFNRWLGAGLILLGLLLLTVLYWSRKSTIEPDLQTTLFFAAAAVGLIFILIVNLVYDRKYLSEERQTGDFKDPRGPEF